MPIIHINGRYLTKGNIKKTANGSSIPPDTIFVPNDTVYYRLIVTNIHGCKPDTLQRMFVTIDNPIASFNRSDTAGCTTLPVLFTNTSTVGVSAVWDFGNNQSSSLFSPPSINFVNPSNISDSIYKVKLVVTAGSGCKDSITKDIRVFPKPKAIFNNTNPICAIDTASAFNNSIFKGGITTYRWKFIQNTSSTINDTASFSPLFTFTNNQSSVDSTYNIRLWVTSVDGCLHDTIRPITVLRRPKAVFATGANINCGPALYTMNNTTSNVVSSYLWTTNLPSTIITDTS
ncbi:MAG: hypothetical protein IPK03_06130 [Bacteroidetes bacterium]|nr:hypothetical protein [Bacteroidota bacterium]